MFIQSVIPQPSGMSTTIWAHKEGQLPQPYDYSHTYELIRDPSDKNNGWMQWNGGTLTEALQFIISLPSN